MIKFEIDNPVLEKLAIELFEKLLNGLTPSVLPEKKEPIKLPPLPSEVKVHNGLESDFPVFNPKVPDKLPYGMTQLTLSEPEKPEKKVRKTYAKRDETLGFPLSWVKRINDKISARQAFSVKDITGEERNPQGVSNLKKWLSDGDKVTIERLLHIPGHPYLFIPTWEDSKGVTQFAKNAIELKSRMAMVATKELDPESLNRAELVEMKRLGFNLKVPVS